MSAVHRGRLKWWMAHAHYGLVSPDDAGPDVVVHLADDAHQLQAPPVPGEEVQYHFPHSWRGQPPDRVLSAAGLHPGLGLRDRWKLAELLDSVSAVTVLALDGGGVRGLFQARVLQRITNEVSTHFPIRLGMDDYFSLVAGTSTGAIIAAALTTPSGAMGRVADRSNAVTELYRDLAREVFRESVFVTRLRWAVRGKYRADVLERILNEQVGDALIAQARPEVLIPAYNMDEARTVWFSSDGPLAFKVPLWKAARASSAAPTYFPWCRIDDLGRFVDGGVGANNPTLKATAEALRTWTHRRDGLYWEARALAVRLPVKVVVISVGNGTRAPMMPRNNGALAWAARVAELFGHSSATTAVELAAVLPPALVEYDDEAQAHRLLRYVRIDPGNHRGARLDDASSAVLASLEESASEVDIDPAVRALVGALKQRFARASHFTWRHSGANLREAVLIPTQR